MYLLAQFNNGCNNCNNSIGCDTKQPFYWWQSHRHCKHCHTVNSNLMQSKNLICTDRFSLMLSLSSFLHTLKLQHDLPFFLPH